MFNVLVIEDNADVRDNLKKFLGRLGCEVSVAETAENGIEQLNASPFDAVFAALCMHSFGGRGIARLVKNQANPTKFFIMTSWKGELERDLLRFDGIHDVIRKPFSFGEIRDKVLEHLG